MHQPIQPPLDETSAESEVTGGTLDGQGPASTPVQAVPNFQAFSDLTGEELEYERTLTVTSATDILFVRDPLKSLMPFSTGDNVMPCKYLKLLTTHYFDADIGLKLIAIKHEKVRGKIMFTWFPGVTPDYELTKEITFQTDFTGLPDWMVTNTEGNPMNQVRVQRWIWDLEKTDQFSLVLNGTNPRILRPTLTHQNVVVNSANGYTLYPTFRTSDPQNMGILIARFVTPYAPGGIAPATMDILMFNALLNFKAMEYRSPMGTLDAFTYNFRN